MEKVYFENIETERLILREVTKEDINEIYEVYSDPEVAKYDWFYPIKSEEQALKIIENYKEELECEEEITWGIVLKESKKLIGICCLGDFDKLSRRAEIGYDISQKNWNKGYGAEAIGAIVDYGFKKLNLNRIEAFITPGNNNSIRVLEKCNFKQEGIVRERDYIKGKLEDGVIMAILQKDIYPDIDIYENCPTYENGKLILRKTTLEDGEALLKCYSDKESVRFFNSDNCNGDDFHYTTLERMNEAIRFWNFSYEHRYFVRFSVIEKLTSEVIGTVEMFHREALDEFNHYGLLRIDLKSEFEKEKYITNILDIVNDNFYRDFNVEIIMTKAIPDAVERIKALKVKSYSPLDKKMVIYDDYFIRRI